MRDQVSADQRRSIDAIRRGAAALSELLAQGSLEDDALDRAAQFLISCRNARRDIERGSGRQTRPALRYTDCPCTCHFLVRAAALVLRLPTNPATILISKIFLTANVRRRRLVSS